MALKRYYAKERVENISEIKLQNLLITTVLIYIFSFLFEYQMYHHNNVIIYLSFKTNPLIITQRITLFFSCYLYIFADKLNQIKLR